LEHCLAQIQYLKRNDTHKRIYETTIVVYKRLAMLKINMTGLSLDALNLFPSQISGGMKKRAGLARALALDPEILFLDEPTSGLDPIGARNFDDLILKLRDLLGVTIVMITHDKTVSKTFLIDLLSLGIKKLWQKVILRV